MKDSGMSNSQFMKAQKGFQDNHPEYKKLVEKLNQTEGKCENCIHRCLTSIKNCLKWIVRSGRSRQQIEQKNKIVRHKKEK